MGSTFQVKKPRQDRVVSFRLTSEIAHALERWAQTLNDPKCATADRLARRLVLDALPPSLNNALFNGSLTDAVPAFDVIVGDAEATLRKVRTEVVDSIVVSPPYLGQKKYGGGALEIGRERDTDFYIDRLTRVFRECQRVLKPVGTLFIIIDDTYRRKNLLGVPWRLMSALQQDGWCVRSEAIWNKNGMPEGVDDRPTRTHEFVYMLVKQPNDYYYNAEAIREPFESRWSVDCIRKAQEAGVTGRPSTNPFSKEERHNHKQSGISRAAYGALMNPNGRNKRSVWSINTDKTSVEHYATCPEALVRICITSGCPPNGVVLDCFSGAGSTGVAAVNIGRKFLGIELVEKFARIARTRIEAAVHQQRHDLGTSQNGDQNSLLQ